MRLLVLDQSRILPWLVEHDLACQPDLAVEAVTCLHEAERIVREQPPDAAVVSLPHAALDWREFQHLCASSVPPIPVLYEACRPTEVAELGLEPPEGYALFLPKPAPIAEFHRALETLIAIARAAREPHFAPLERRAH